MKVGNNSQTSCSNVSCLLRKEIFIETKLIGFIIHKNSVSFLHLVPL